MIDYAREEDIRQRKLEEENKYKTRYRGRVELSIPFDFTLDDREDIYYEEEVMNILEDLFGIDIFQYTDEIVLDE